MKNLLKILLLFVLSINSFSFGQDYSKGFSDGELVLENKKVAVKIFASNYLNRVSEILQENQGVEILVILNKFNTEARNRDSAVYLVNYYQDLENNGCLVLDEEFRPLKISSETLENIKYILKTEKLTNKELVSSREVSLDTKYKIWNPKEGIDVLGFSLRFYGLMFVIAFGLGFIVMKHIFKIDNVDEKYLDPLFTWTLLGTIFGARIGHVLFYDVHLFREDFWSVFLPVRTKPYFEFTGFSGLASHGAAIALILTTLYYSLKIVKKNPLWVYDRLAIVIALAGFFIRIGNFFNSEIIGKPVSEDSFFAVLFPQQSSDYGLTVPRYPTQLIEAIGYLGLFFLLWGIYKLTDKKNRQGWLFGIFLLILWSIRFLAEFLKEPQGEEYISFLGLNTGQILSIPFVIIGGILMLNSKKNIQL